MSIREDLIDEACARLRKEHGAHVLDVPEGDAWKLVAHELAVMLAESRKARGP